MPAELRDNDMMTKLAVQKSAYAFEEVSDRLKDKESLALQAIQKNPYAFAHASERLRGDLDVVMAAVNLDPSLLQHASNEMRENPDIVLEAVKKDPRAIEFAGDNIKREFYDFAVSGIYEKYKNIERIPEKYEEEPILTDDEFEGEYSSLDDVIDSAEQISDSIEYEDEERDTEEFSL